MKILAFDTAMNRCSVALADDGAVLSHESEPRARGHAEILLPMIAECLEEAGVELQDVERIATTVGPGSFTGVRVGVAAARGLALATGADVVGVTTLEAVAHRWMSDNRDVPRLMVLQDARRGALYAQSFEHGKATDEARLIDIDEAAALCAGHTVIGTGARLIDRADVPAHDPEPDARVVADLARAKPPRAHDGFLPFYLRAPDAKKPNLSPLERLRAGQS